MKKTDTGNVDFRRVIQSFCAVVLFLIALGPEATLAQKPQEPKPTGAEAIPEPAIPAILAAFDKYEVVGLPAAHEGKDLDDFILLLVRNPAFSEKVTDIAVECGNSLSQPVLDRYMAGEDVPFSEVRKVWRNTTQPTCGTSEFFNRFFPLIRAVTFAVIRERVGHGSDAMIKHYMARWQSNNAAEMAKLQPVVGAFRGQNNNCDGSKVALLEPDGTKSKGKEVGEKAA
jgi:hypothetical protein